MAICKGTSTAYDQSRKMPENHPAGAEAQRLLSGICGTTEVTPKSETGMP
jgi:hypothetical protein